MNCAVQKSVQSRGWTQKLISVSDTDMCFCVQTICADNGSRLRYWTRKHVSMYDAEIIAMRPNRAMWLLDSDDDGGGFEMIEHDDGVGGGGGN